MQVFADADALHAALASSLAGRIGEAVRARGACSLALSGGRTPRALYERLARRHLHDVPWPRVHVFWSDERYVPPEDERSNYRMARETLLDHVPVPAAHVHRMPTGPADIRQAAAACERELRAHFGTPWPRFDLMLLGIGDDGHTASLFPGAPALDETDRWVAAATAPVEPRERLTLTLPAINHAAAIHVLVCGRGKAAALREALSGDADPRRLPASALRPVDGTIEWWADAAAAGDR
jgi:6-phosphogluconolactonase